MTRPSQPQNLRWVRERPARSAFVGSLPSDVSVPYKTTIRVGSYGTFMTGDEP